MKTQVFQIQYKSLKQERLSNKLFVKPVYNKPLTLTSGKIGKKCARSMFSWQAHFFWSSVKHFRSKWPACKRRLFRIPSSHLRSGLVRKNDIISYLVIITLFAIVRNPNFRQGTPCVRGTLSAEKTRAAAVDFYFYLWHLAPLVERPHLSCHVATLSTAPSAA